MNTNFSRNSNQTSNDKVYINSAIRLPKLLVIMDGQNLGVMPTYEALKLAQDNGLDLVLVSPPSNGRFGTAKILDHGKLKYEESKNKKAAEKKQREAMIETKEIKFRPITGINDLKIKANKTSEFLTKGHQVKITIVFRGREVAHKEVAAETLEEFLSFLPEADLLGEPSFEGSKSLSVMLVKKEP